MNKETFCSLPFNEIFLGPDGNIKSCCSSEVNLGNLNENSIGEILQGSLAQRVRQSIIDGVWDPACRQCERQFQQGVNSERVGDLDSFLKNHGPITKEFFKLQRLDLRWSNVCNLSCTYCYEYFSSKWAEIKGIKVNNINDENEKSLMLLIEQQKTTVENVLLLGGEPFLQKQNYELAKTLTGKSFYVLTNLAVPLANNRVANEILKQPSLQIGISFETVRSRYEYVRHGADWSVFNKNLAFINDIRPDVVLDAHSLYSIYSAFNLVEFYEYIQEQGIFTNVFWNLLESAGENQHASILKLDNRLKYKAIDELDRCVERFPTSPGIDNLLSIKNTLLKSLEEVCPMDPKNKDFLLEAEIVEKKLKKIPGKLFSDLWPDLNNELAL